MDVLGIMAPHPPIMVSEVGGTRASATRDSERAMQTAAALLKAFAPDTIVLMSPHAPVVRDAFVIDSSKRYWGDLGGFGASQVRLAPPGDPELAEAIAQEAAADGIRVIDRTTAPSLEAGDLDHGAMVPLSFLDREGRYPLVEVSLSFMPLPTHRAFGGAIRRACERLGRRVAFVASGDMSHRLKPDAPAGFSPSAHLFDEQVVGLLGRGFYRSLEDIDPQLIEAAGECGLRSFITLGGFLKGTAVDTRVLAYEGPWGVGYLTAVAGRAELLDRVLTPSEGRKGGIPGGDDSEPVLLARRAIEAYVRQGRVLPDPPAEGLLGERRGAFVSLHRNGSLRGCIGTIAPTRENLASEIIHNAVQAATRDPRFPPMGPDELADLEISVDVLNPPEPAMPEDLDPACYGVIVSCDWRRGLLLPDLPGIETVGEQVAVACAKAGIDPGERITIERFSVERYR